MPIIDLHCDTATLCYEKGWEMSNNPHTHLSLHRMASMGGWCQAFAIYIPDHLRGEQAVDFYNRAYAFYRQQLQKYSHLVMPVSSFDDIDIAARQGKVAAMLTVEGGCVLCGDPDRVNLLAEQGVKMLTLTWNAANEIAGGQAEDIGLTDAGRRVIPRMEEQGMIVDVSHLGDTGFWQLMEIARRPVVASHSNSRTICPHPRNLTDDQFKAIVKIRGLVGLNFYEHFLAQPANDLCFDHLLAHIRHFLSLGGEDVIALGSDFDGAEVPAFIDRDTKLASFAQSMIKSGLSKGIVEKILWKNAYDFFKRYEQDSQRYKK